MLVHMHKTHVMQFINCYKLRGYQTARVESFPRMQQAPFSAVSVAGLMVPWCRGLVQLFDLELHPPHILQPVVVFFCHNIPWQSSIRGMSADQEGEVLLWRCRRLPILTNNSIEPGDCFTHAGSPVCFARETLSILFVRTCKMQVLRLGGHQEVETRR